MAGSSRGLTGFLTAAAEQADDQQADEQAQTGFCLSAQQHPLQTNMEYEFDAGGTFLLKQCLFALGLLQYW